MSTDTEATDLKTLIAAAAKAPAHDLDELKAMTTLPPRYVEVHLARRFGGPLRGDTRDTSLRRLSTRVVADSVTNGRLAEDRIVTLFEHAAVTVAGVKVHVAFESGGGTFELDDGYWTALTDWTF